MWQPDVVGIKESDIFAFSLGDTEISRGAHAPVFVTGMLQIAYLVRILFCISQSITTGSRGLKSFDQPLRIEAVFSKASHRDKRRQLTIASLVISYLSVAADL